MSDPEQHQEIIIIKRGGNEEDGHHGGAWKIAFADFMTAMMALFLVLWLINAANEETKKAVASYFNPVKLVDQNRSTKGLHDADGVQEIEETVSNEKFPEQEEQKSESDDTSQTDSQFFADPFAVLDEIASHEAPGALKQIEEEGGRDGEDAVNDASGGQAFMDPFSPNFWNEEVRPSNDRGQLSGRYDTSGEEATKVDVAQASDGGGGEDGPEIGGNGITGPETGGNGVEGEETGSGSENVLDVDGMDPAPETDMSMQTASFGGESEDEMFDAGHQKGPESLLTVDVETEVEMGTTDDVAISEEMSEPDAMPEDGEIAAEEAKPTPAELAAEDIREQIGEELVEAFGEDSALTRELKVTADGGEIMISLTDAFDLSMFGIGSAVPSRELVLALEKVGGVLAEQSGNIRVRGHTDARPFKSEEYDNWRLSAARAHSAYYMLLRGGLEDTRVREISGFADRALLDPENPFSDKNRRIEVLLEVTSR